jgi:hypothetical protein
MAGQGGPDEETWRNMSPLAKRVYWVLVAVVAGSIGVAALIKLFR